MRKGYGAGDYASYKTYSWDFEVRTTIALMLHNLVQSDSFNLYMCLGFWTNWQTIFESEKMSPFFAFLSLFPQSMVNGRHFSDTIAANLQLALCVRNNITKVDWRDFFELAIILVICDVLLLITRCVGTCMRIATIMGEYNLSFVHFE